MPGKTSARALRAVSLINSLANDYPMTSVRSNDMLEAIYPRVERLTYAVLEASGIDGVLAWIYDLQPADHIATIHAAICIIANLLSTED